MSDKTKTKSNKLTFAECYSTSFGMLVGSGIISMTGLAIGYTGSGVFLAYILAGALCLISNFPLFIATSVVPKTSGNYFCAGAISDTMAGLFAYLYFFGSISISFYGASFVSYLLSIVNIPLDTRIIALASLLVFFIANLYGGKTVAKLQTLMNIFLLAAWVSFLFLGLPKVNPGNFSMDNMFPNGFQGLMEATTMLVFAMGGGLWLTNSGGRIENPEKNIVKGNLLATGTGMVLFALISVVAAGVLPLAEVSGQPLTLVAKAIYPGAGYLFFVIGGALCALTTTMNASYLNMANALYKTSQDGWFPDFMGKKNNHGVPWVLMTICFVISAIPIILGVDTTLLSRMTTGFNYLTKLLPNIALIAIVNKYPDAWKNSRYHMKRSVLIPFQVICNIILVWLIYRNLRNFPVMMYPVIIGLVILFVVIAHVRTKKVQAIKEARIAEDPDE